MIRPIVRLISVLILLGSFVASLPASRAAGAGRAYPPPEDPELLLPDLQTLPPSNLDIRHRASPKAKLLRLTNAVANTGPGPIELAGKSNPATGRTAVRQYFSTNMGGRESQSTGEFVFHPSHDHWHLGGFARYELWSVSLDGQLTTLVGLSDKVSYCLRDSYRIGEGVSASQAAYTSCGSELQGISPGWVDTYQYYLPGQTIDISGLPDGVYALRSIVDPNNMLREQDETNNAATTYLELQGDRVRAIDIPGLQNGLRIGTGRGQ